MTGYLAGWGEGFLIPVPGPVQPATATHGPGLCVASCCWFAPWGWLLHSADAGAGRRHTSQLCTHHLSFQVLGCWDARVLSAAGVCSLPLLRSATRNPAFSLLCTGRVLCAVYICNCLVVPVSPLWMWGARRA